MLPTAPVGLYTWPTLVSGGTTPGDTESVGIGVDNPLDSDDGVDPIDIAVQRAIYCVQGVAVEFWHGEGSAAGAVIARTYARRDHPGCRGLSCGAFIARCDVCASSRPRSGAFRVLQRHDRRTGARCSREPCTHWRYVR